MAARFLNSSLLRFHRISSHYPLRCLNRHSTRGFAIISASQKEKLIKRNTQAMKMLDLNQDGFLSFEDYKIAADNYSKGNPLVKNNVMERYITALKSVFEFLGLLEGTKMTIKEAVEKTAELIDDPEYIKRTKALYSAVFDTLDVDGNDFLSPKEWVGFMDSLKFTDPSKGKEIFEMMDLNKDGQLSREEFVEMSFEYWHTGDNNHGGDSMFGNQ